MAGTLKKLVSKKKRRFQEEGFDLDMTFITNRIVAMGFPAESLEGVYRNNMKDVKKFFDRKYPDHYKVYNLCSERDYDKSKFYGRVAKYPFDDHNAPPFTLMEPFCKDVANYLAKDERNVAVVHCKAGKGRTGVMICAYLIHCRFWEKTDCTAKTPTERFTGQIKSEQALSYYGHARTTNGKGVTIPSQIRYVKYYEEYLNSGKPYTPTHIIMTKIILKGVPNFKDGGCTPQFVICQSTTGKNNAPEKQVLHRSEPYDTTTRDQSEVVLTLKQPQVVVGDIKVEFLHKTSMSKEKMFHLWFNTAFVHNLKFHAVKPCIDKANKDKKHKTFPADFAVEIYFDAPRTSRPQQPSQVPVSPASGRPMAASVSQMSFDVDAWSDSDLTDDDEEDEDEWIGLPISDV